MLNQKFQLEIPSIEKVVYWCGKKEEIMTMTTILEKILIQIFSLRMVVEEGERIGINENLKNTAIAVSLRRKRRIKRSEGEVKGNKKVIREGVVM